MSNRSPYSVCMVVCNESSRVLFNNLIYGYMLLCTIICIDRLEDSSELVKTEECEGV